MNQTPTQKPEKQEVNHGELTLDFFRENRRTCKQGVSSRRVAEITHAWRPINNGDIIGDLVWRRQPPEITTRMIRKAGLLDEIAWRLRRFDIYVEADDLSIKWNRYLGCSMCPCSPGWEVILKDKKATAPLLERKYAEVDQYYQKELAKAGINRTHLDVWVQQPRNSTPRKWNAKDINRWVCLDYHIGYAPADEEVSE